MCRVQAAKSSDDRRTDSLLRDLVQDCQAILAAQGFELTSRGTSYSGNWVRFSGPARHPVGRAGTLTVLLAHSPGERAVLADAYFEDTEPRIPVPQRKLLQRYDVADTLPPVLREFVTAVSGAA